MREFVSKYNLPAYKGSGRGFENEQIDGRDPILEVEAVYLSYMKSVHRVCNVENDCNLV